MPYDQAYYEKNREYYQNYYKNYHSEPSNKLKNVCRTRFRKAMQAQRLDPKIDDVLELLDSEIEEFVSYVESKMCPGMTWENFGNRLGCWSLDHKIPLSALKLDDKETRKFAFRWDNIDCLWQSDNKAKGNLVDISKISKNIKLRYAPKN
jgi:hypothetical protein